LCKPGHAMESATCFPIEGCELQPISCLAQLSAGNCIRPKTVATGAGKFHTPPGRSSAGELLSCPQRHLVLTPPCTTIQDSSWLRTVALHAHHKTPVIPDVLASISTNFPRFDAAVFLTADLAERRRNSRSASMNSPGATTLSTSSRSRRGGVPPPRGHVAGSHAQEDSGAVDRNYPINAVGGCGGSPSCSGNHFPELNGCATKMPAASNRNGETIEDIRSIRMVEKEPTRKAFFGVRCTLRAHRPCHVASVKRLWQHGHAPSNPRTSAKKALGCGSVIIARNAGGARWA
jgi:hypothetical protein